MELLDLGLLGLFVGAFLSATILPFSSDILLYGALEAGFPFIPCLIIATIGNLLGGLTNYYIGYKSHTNKLEKRFKLNKNKLDRWEKRLSKWGVYLGLISWVPIIGDPMVVALGFFRVKFIPLAIMMLIGKFIRYIAIIILFYYINS